MKILVAMSGGVDSSVAAAMLVEQGYDVTGVHLRLSDAQPGADPSGRQHGCCGITDADDARRVAQVLDVPFYVWNLKDVFAEGVIDDFVGEYRQGRTPNPCVRCNEKVKFGALQERALALGFDAIATGHYARVERTDGRWRLFRGADRRKDQSYVLARLGQEQLAHALFPVGAQEKQQTRAIAENLALRVANKPESFDICFVQDGDAAGFVERAVGGPRAGEIVDTAGRVLGSHHGTHRFTVGQRRGIGVSTLEPSYVVEIDAGENRVVVGAAALLARRGLRAEQVRWTAGKPVPVETVQIRAHGEPIPATLEHAAGASASFRFGRAERGVAPGQLVAFYVGDEVVGGGTIEEAFR